VRAQYLIHPLLALNTAFADKLGADNHCLEVMAIAFDLQVFAGQTRGDKFLDLLRVHHGSVPQFITAT
jgi:hypothetical protein